MTDPDLPPPADDVELTVPEVGRELRVSEWTVRQLIYTGELHGWRAGLRNYRINRSELDRWLSTTGADSELDADDALYTVPEVAKKLRVTEWTVREWIKAGRLDAWRAGRRRYRLRTRRRLVMQRNTYLLELGHSPVRRRAAPDRRAGVRPARGAALTTTGDALRSLWCRRRQPAPRH